MYLPSKQRTGVRFSHTARRGECILVMHSDTRLGTCGVAYSVTGRGSGSSAMYALIVAATPMGR